MTETRKTAETVEPGESSVFAHLPGNLGRQLVRFAEGEKKELEKRDVQVALMGVKSKVRQNLGAIYSDDDSFLRLLPPEAQEQIEFLETALDELGSILMTATSSNHTPPTRQN